MRRRPQMCPPGRRDLAIDGAQTNRRGVPSTGWRRHLTAIGGPDGFRGPIVRAVCAAVAEAGGAPEGLDDALAEEVTAVVLAADPGGRDRRTIERYAGAAHTRDIALWAARRQARQAAQVERLRADVFRTAT